ncbi:MAG: DNRLRE domain-containing protein [Bacteroidia bacterium]
MKKTLLFGLIAPLTIIAQTQTLTLRPNATAGKDAFVTTLSPLTNYGNYIENDAIDWTNGGTPFTSRSFIYFDLSALPAGATIVSANLNLYGLTSSSNSQLSTGSNSCHLQNITASWTESGVTWNNQPTTTNTNEVTLAQSTSTSQNYLNINVLNLVNDQITNSYYGFMLKLLNENTYNSMVFGSSDNTDSTKWPLLQIQYNAPSSDSTCVVFQPDTAGKDAYITSLSSSANYGTYIENDAISWTNGGTAFNSRSLIQFNLSSIPTTAVVTSAVLSLYGDTSTSNTQGSTGSNAAYLNMITSSWQENTVTWNNQPTTTTTNQVIVPQSTSTSQNYPSINIANFVQSWVTTPSANNGMMLDLQTEATYRSLVLCSSDYPHAGQHPKLEVCYTTQATSIKNNSLPLNDITIYPNPVNNNLTISLGSSLKADNIEVNMINVLGQTFDQSATKFDNLIQINTESLAKGSYVILIKNNITGNVVYKHIIKE